MKYLRNAFTVLTLSFTLILSGCVTPPPYDYSALIESSPRSILVIPPTNQSVDVNAPYTYLSTVSKPLAEKGYYVFPVSVIDTFLKENGLPTPAEMNTIPLDKIREHIGADAVLYVNIIDWGQKFKVLSSNTIVKAKLRLIDARTGTELWATTVYGEEKSDSGNNGLLGAIAGAVVAQIAGSIKDKTPRVARYANDISIYHAQRGLLEGPYRPKTEAP